MATKIIARYPKKSPCVDVLIAAGMSGQGGLKWTPKPDDDPPALLWVPGGEELKGRSTLLRYFSRQCQLYPGVDLTDLISAGLVDEWIASAIEQYDDRQCAVFCERINKHLTLRTFLVGHVLTAADLAVYGTLRVSKAYLSELHRDERLVHLQRWYRYVSAQAAVAEVEKKVLAKGFEYVAAPVAALEGDASVKVPVVRNLQASKAYYMSLEGAEDGQVVTRFPPEPSGFLHLGHIKAALLNAAYAEQYHGKMLLRFDDTNPSKENVGFVDAIKADLKTIEAPFVQVTYTSDYFELLQQKCEEMIRAGDAYADSTPNEEMKKMRMDRVPSPFREKTVAENLALWEQIKAGSEEGRKAVIRAKIEQSAWANSTMRDPVMYRCVSDAHHRTGTKYKAYPTYDFACPIVDSIEGVTHALRTNEYHQRNDQYYWFLRKMALKPVRIEDYSRLNFAYTLLSKRKLQWFVDTKRVEGWDSPAFPTVQGVFRRGLTLGALKKYILAQGASKNVNNQDWDKLWALNKQMIDSVVPRYMAVKAESKVRLRLTNAPKELQYVTAPRHAKNSALGTRAIAQSAELWIEGEDAALLKEGVEFTLMHWGCVVPTHISASEVVGELKLDHDPRKPELKITWLADLDNNVQVTMQEYDYLITKAKLEEDDRLEDYINPGICLTTPVLADASIRLAKKGDMMQFERLGYFIVDKPFNPVSGEIVVIRIEDGKDSTPSHLSSKLFTQRSIWKAREAAEAAAKK